MFETHKRKVCEQQANKLVDEFDVQKDLPCNSVIRMPDLLEMDKRVHRSEESSIQPSSSLGDEFWYSVWHL